jgi:hypothetical protein
MRTIGYWAMLRARAVLESGGHVVITTMEVCADDLTKRVSARPSDVPAAKKSDAPSE